MSDTTGGVIIFPNDDEILEFFSSKIVRSKTFNYGFYSQHFFSETGFKSRLLILTPDGASVENATIFAFNDNMSAETILDVIYEDKDKHGP